MQLIKVASRLVLPVLMVVLAACSSKQEGSRGTPVSQPQAAQPVAVSPQLVGLLPEDHSVPGWSRSRQPRGFGPDNLWEYIDGAAESYLAAGFEQVVTAEYSNTQKGLQVVIDIYRMKDATRALGIFSAELNPDGQLQPIGMEGCLSGNALNFWAGPYYVKITAGAESPELQQEMLRLAEKISSRLGPKKSAGN